MADINYAKAYAGADRQFASSYVGAITKQPIIHYLGAYTKVWNTIYAKVWLGQYTGTWGATYGKVYVGLYEGQFDKQYEGSFTGQFDNCLLYTSPSPRD